MADIFNPQADLPKANDFLGYSKGVRDNSLGEFASGIAGTLDSGLKAIDRGVAEMANNEVDKVVNDTDSQLLGIKNQGPAADPLQAEIKQQVGNLADKKLAMDNGTIDPQHYYATIQAKVKDIRQRYSGYNPQIDEELQRIGIDPNWQRKQIIAEGEKAANARSNAAQEAVKNAREFKEKALTDPNLLLPKALRDEMTNDPSFELHPDKMKALRGAYANSNALTSGWQAEKTQAELGVATGKAQSVALGESYGNGLNLLLHKAGMNSGAQELVTNLAKKAMEERVTNGAVSPETDNQLRMAFGQFRNGMNSGRLGLKGQYSDSISLFPEEMKKQDEAFDAQLDQIGDAITNKDYGALLYNTNAIASYSAASNAKLLSNPAVAVIKSTRETMGDAGVAVLAADNAAEFRDPIIKHMQGVRLAEQSRGESKSLNDTMIKLRNDGTQDPAIYRGTFNKTIKFILDPDMKDAGSMANAKALFSPENQGFWDNLDANGKLSDADRRGYARTLASPQMASRIEELSKLDPRIKEQYLSYTHYVFQKMNKDTASNINDTVKNSNSITVKYDPITNHLAVAPIIPQGRSVAGKMLDQATAALRGSSADNAIANFNTGVDTLTPIWKSYGLDPKEMSQGLAQELGINLNQPKATSSMNNYRGSNVPPAIVPNTPDGLDTSTAGSTLRDGENKGLPQGGNSSPEFKGIPNADNPLGTPGKPYYAGGPDQGGGAGSVPQYSSPAFSQALAAHSPEALDARSGIVKELGELKKLQDGTEDPEFKSQIGAEIKSLLTSYRSIGASNLGGPVGNYQDTSPDVKDQLQKLYPGASNDNVGQGQQGLPDVSPTGNFAIDKGDGATIAKGLKSPQDVQQWDSYFKFRIQNAKDYAEPGLPDSLAKPAADRVKQLEQEYKNFQKSIPRDLKKEDGPRDTPQSFMPRGNPAPGTPTDAQSATGKAVVDAVTGIPSLVDAIQSGNKKDLAVAMASIIPFPIGGRIAKGIKTFEDLVKPAVLANLPVEKITTIMSNLEAAMAKIKDKTKTDHLLSVHYTLDQELEKRGLDVFGKPMRGPEDADYEKSVKALEDLWGKKTPDDVVNQLLETNRLPLDERIPGNQKGTPAFTRTVMTPDGKEVTTEGLSPAQLAALRKGFKIIDGGKK